MNSEYLSMAILGSLNLLFAGLFWSRERLSKAHLSDTEREWDERSRKITADADVRVAVAEQRVHKMLEDGDERCRRITKEADARVSAAEERVRKAHEDGDKRCRKIATDADARVKLAEEARCQAEQRYFGQIEQERAKWLTLGVAAGGKEMKVCVFKGKRSVTGIFVKTQQQAMLVVGPYQDEVKFLDGDSSDLTQYGLPPDIRKAIDKFLCVAEVTAGVPPILKLVK